MPPNALSATIRPVDYELSDDLAKLCLPREFKDTYRNLAWANSICALFLAVGLVGLKAPRVHVRAVVPPVEPQTVLLPAEELPKPEPIEPKTEDMEPLPDTTDVTPAVVSVVAADAPNVAFAVPVNVSGPVAIAATAAQASAPPANNYAPPAPKATKFVIGGEGTQGGVFPPPTYPGFALRNRYQGTVILDIWVSAAGAVTKVEIQKSSGYAMLDQAAVDVVKNRWRFPPGQERAFFWNCKFEIN